MKHHLSLDVPDIYNSKIMRVIDTSVYADNLPVDCAYVQITAPGFTSPVQIEVVQGFNLILTACALGIQLEDCPDLLYCLPDGLYHIRYSVSPAEKVYVEYNYLRVTRTLNTYYTELASLELGACEPDECIQSRLKDLRVIKSFIDAAKAKVEYLADPEEGSALFVYAQKRLVSYTETCC
jgi:hypothetical protein